MKKIVEMKNFLVISKGFTIVELLVVVVVIAVLATISVVAYNGFSKKAELSKLSFAISQYKKILTIYKIETGNSLFDIQEKYRNGTWSSSVCLGRLEDYPANTRERYSQGACYKGFSSGVVPQLMDHLEDITNTKIPSIRTNIYGSNLRGVILTKKALLYMVPGTKCFSGDTASSTFRGFVHCWRKL